MSDEELWAMYFSSSFAGRRGNLFLSNMVEYVDWADKALEQHRFKWPNIGSRKP